MTCLSNPRAGDFTLEMREYIGNDNNSDSNCDLSDNAVWSPGQDVYPCFKNSNTPIGGTPH